MAIKIHFIGKDANYWNLVQNEYRLLFPTEKFQFSTHFIVQEEKFEILLIDLAHAPPEIILMEFLPFYQESLQLLNQLRRESITKKITIIGLIEDNSDPKMIFDATSLGVNIIHRKSIEISDVIFHSMIKSFPEKSRQIDFATAVINLETKGETQFRLGFMNDELIHFECNFEFSEGEVLILEHSVIKDLSLSKYFKILSSGRENIYSYFHICYQASFEMLKDKKILELEERIPLLSTKLARHPNDKKTKFDLNHFNQELLTLTQKREEEGNKQKGLLKQWISNTRQTSHPKFTKVLIFDRQLKFLKQSKTHLDSYPFALRCHSQIDENASVISAYMADIIVMDFQDESKDVHAITNDQDALQKIVDEIKQMKKKFPTYQPIILIFSATENAKTYQENFSYEKILSYSQTIDAQFIIPVVEKLQTKKNQSLDQQIHNRVYFDKYSSLSRISYKVPLTILSINESELFFTSRRKIPVKTNFFIKHPFPLFFVTTSTGLNPHESHEKVYRGLIFGLNESDKKSLRRLVNDLIFSKHGL